MARRQKPRALTKKEKSALLLGVLASLTLGLAPFFPEPHLLGKWRWLLGGAKGMQSMDWFDFMLHSAPWAFLIVVVIRIVLVRVKVKRVSK